MGMLRATLTSFRPTEPEPMEIILDGRRLGEVKPVKYPECVGDIRHWYAAFHHDEKLAGPLLQGFGETPEEAIDNAFIETRVKLENDLIIIDELKAAMYSE